MSEKTKDEGHLKQTRNMADVEEKEDTISDFKGLLKTARHTKDIATWVASADMRQNLFANLAFGQIRWPKALGRPASPTLSAGFDLQSEAWYDVWYIGQDGGIVEKKGWMAGDQPTLWDGPDDNEDYIVKYLFYADALNYNQVRVRLSQVPWQPRRLLYLSAPGWQFYGGGRFTALPDITLDIRPASGL